MSTIHIVKPIKEYDKYGELRCANVYKITYYCHCVQHYPSDSKTTISEIGQKYSEHVEGTRHLEVAWVELCTCSCCPCDVDIHEGYYAYLSNKFWKIIGTKTYENCGCYVIKLILERLEPRETHKSLIECVNCFDIEGYVHKNLEKEGITDEY